MSQTQQQVVTTQTVFTVIWSEAAETYIIDLGTFQGYIYSATR